MIFSQHDDSIFISLPGKLFNYSELEFIVGKHKGVHIHRNHRNTIMIDIIKDKNASSTIRKIFTEYHNIETNFLDYQENFISSPEPLVSCVILLNSNYKFVNELTIPSIIFNSKDIPIEIIVVNNGNKKDFELNENVLLTESDKFHIPKAYNKGASLAKGEYLAFFHDDCFLNDEQWIEKAIENLNDDVISVGPEYHIFKDDEDYQMRCSSDKKGIWDPNSEDGYLKETPMIIKREKFLELKGFPDTEVMGQEDIFLHQNILKTGKKNLQVDIKQFHFAGISTLSLFSTKQDLIQDLCSHFILSRKEVSVFKRAFTTRLMEISNLCGRLYDNNLYDEQYSPLCDDIKEYGSGDNDVHKFMAGIFNTFIRCEDEKAFDILDDFVSFDEIISRVLNEL